MKMPQIHCEASECAAILKASSQSFDMINNTARSIFAEPQKTYPRLLWTCTANEHHKNFEISFFLSNSFSVTVELFTIPSHQDFLVINFRYIRFGSHHKFVTSSIISVVSSKFCVTRFCSVSFFSCDAVN